MSPRRELAVGFGELRVYIHVRVVGGSVRPGNLSSLQKTSATSSGQWKSAFVRYAYRTDGGSLSSHCEDSCSYFYTIYSCLFNNWLTARSSFSFILLELAGFLMENDLVWVLRNPLQSCLPEHTALCSVRSLSDLATSGRIQLTSELKGHSFSAGKCKPDNHKGGIWLLKKNRC